MIVSPKEALYFILPGFSERVILTRVGFFQFDLNQVRSHLDKG